MMEIICLSEETSFESIVNGNISLKIFLSNWNMEHEHTKEATVDAIVKNCERKVFIVNIVRKIFVKLKHGKNRHGYHEW